VPTPSSDFFTPLSSTLKEEDESSTEVFVPIYHTTRCHNPEDSTLHSYRHDKSRGLGSGHVAWRISPELNLKMWLYRVKKQALRNGG
jgi:hypothetical protein